MAYISKILDLILSHEIVTHCKHISGHFFISCNEAIPTWIKFSNSIVIEG